jgi:ATP-binding cassette subfamily F protein 3
MLTAHHLRKSYDTNLIFNDVSFSIQPGERVGLIGPNGSGKTTLLRILAGIEAPDEGHVILTPASIKTGYLAQGFEIPPGRTLGEVVREATGDLEESEQALERVSAALAAEPERSDLQAQYDDALKRLEVISSAQRGRAAQILEALGLADIPEGHTVGALSGGQKTRLSLALVLLEEPQLLLLDEPTNHLDIAMLEWLENWLRGFPGAALIVSHDRTFLDRTVTRILDLDMETHALREYAGNYSAYLEQYLAERSRKMAAYKDQVYEIRRMKQDIARNKQQSLRVELTTTSRQPGVRRYAKKVARKAKSREKKLDRYLESDERVDKPKAGWQMKLDFEEPEHLGQDVFTSEELAVGYAGSPALLSGLNLSIRAGARIVLTGPNGSGKTTLLRTIAGALEPLASRFHLGSSVRLGYMAQEQELLDPEQSALEALRAVAPLGETEARAFLHFFLFEGDDPLRPSGSLSYGERARLALALLVAQGCNFLLLDEPINHLDIPSRTRFEQALSNFEGTVLAVVHDRYFIERFATQVWVVENGHILDKTYLINYHAR